MAERTGLEGGCGRGEATKTAHSSCCKEERRDPREGLNFVYGMSDSKACAHADGKAVGCGREADV